MHRIPQPMLAILGVAVALILACKSEGTSPAPLPVAAVSVSLLSPLTVGQVAQATVVTKDANGAVLTGRAISWASSDVAVARVDGSGVVTAVGAGTAQISATSESIVGAAALTVTAQSGNVIPGVTDLNCVPTSAPPIPNAPVRTFYVDAQAGNDANAGTSTSAPWQSLDKANATVRAGDLIYLKGTFSNQWIHPGTSGTATAKIVYKVWPGATAVLNGGKYGASIVFDNGLSHIVIDGLEITNIGYPIMLSGGAQANWLRNLYVHDIQSQISIRGASDNRLEDSRIERCGSEAANSGDCIWIEDGASRNVIARNVMQYGGHSLLDIGGDKAGLAFADDNIIAQNDLANPWAMPMGLYGYARRTVVECNLIHDATSTSTVNYPRAGINVSANDNILRYNLIYNNKSDGMQIQGYDFQGILQSPSGNQVYQNTVWGNGGAGFEISQQQGGQVSNNTIQNNIFWNNNLAGATSQGRYYQGGSYDIWVDLYSATSIWPVGSLNGNVIQNNILGSSVAEAGKQWLMIVISAGNRTYTLTQAQTTFGSAMSGNREVDPLLNSSGFTLQTSSPAIDAGKVIFAGQKYTGTAPDLGAREKP